MHRAATTRAGASIRAFALSVGLAATLCGAAPGVAAELKDPLSPLTSSGGSILCFGHDYSPDHLARHPKQMTKSVLLAFQQAFVDVVLTSRRGAPKRIGAGCGWRKGAGIDTSDRKMIPNFNKAAGFNSPPLDRTPLPRKPISRPQAARSFEPRQSLEPPVAVAASLRRSWTSFALPMSSPWSSWIA